MGVAWATKWIGIYASAGLAILFFWSASRRFMEYLHARMRTDDEFDTDTEWARIASARDTDGMNGIFLEPLYRSGDAAHPAPTDGRPNA